MSNSNSSMMIVVVMMMAMVFSVAISGGIGIYGYNQGWFDGTDPPAPPVSTTAPPVSTTDEGTKSSTPTLDQKVYIYANDSCSKDEEGKKWHRMLIDSNGTISPNDKPPMLNCKSLDAGHWKITKAEKYYYYVRNEKTKNYLAVVDGKLAMKDSKGDDAKWSFYKQDENNTWSIRNKSGKFLNVVGNNCNHVPYNNESGLRVYDQDKNKRYALPLEFTWKIATAQHTSQSSIVPTEWQNC